MTTFLTWLVSCATADDGIPSLGRELNKHVKLSSAEALAPAADLEDGVSRAARLALIDAARPRPSWAEAAAL
jgi:hypothetical protein